MRMNWERWVPFLVVWIILDLALEAHGKIKVKDTPKDTTLQRVKRAHGEIHKTLLEKAHQRVKVDEVPLERVKRANHHKAELALERTKREKGPAHEGLKNKVDAHAQKIRKRLKEVEPILRKARRDMTSTELQRMKRNKRNKKEKKLHVQKRDKRNYIHDKRVKGELQKLKSGSHRVKRRQEHHVDENINAHQYQVKLNRKKRTKSHHSLSEARKRGWSHSKKAIGKNMHPSLKQSHHSKKDMDLQHVPVPVMKKKALNTHDHQQHVHNMKKKKNSDINLHREKKNGHEQHIKTVDDFKEDLAELKRLHHTLDMDMAQIAQLQKINKSKRAKRKAHHEKHHRKP